MSKAIKFLTKTFKLATTDIANQYALPVKSLTGYAVTKKTASSSRRLNQLLVDSLNISKDEKILEIGYGRGDALGMCYEKLKDAWTTRSPGGSVLRDGHPVAAWLTDVLAEVVRPSGRWAPEWALDVSRNPVC
ncbi:unnamed protein product [Caenorhabditis auriculariae]|uniref:Uncharacterized protein n=1 Tax=Caenorhabditis auriculariae TaxID=2777116 RepID=A0A8S1H8S2_9PELO|nr:unnamed protein product [Caenorhabditis auriculariae]